MTAAVFRIAWMSLLRHRTELVTAFAVPIVFFTVLCAIFVESSDEEGKVVDVVLVDEDGSEASRALARALMCENGVSLCSGEEGAVSRERARDLVATGAVAVGVVLPRGYAAAAADLRRPARVTILRDPANALAARIVAGSLQRATLVTLADRWRAVIPEGGAIVAIETVDVAGTRRTRVAYYAAGIAVMFLLFAATGGGGGIIDDEASGLLEQLLSTRLGAVSLLAGRWGFMTSLGMLQVGSMLLWAHLVFDLPLFDRLSGLALMTAATAGAAAAFGLLLGALCRTREQLVGISAVAVLTMSALGGSMIPRYLMTPALRDLGLFTFNAWAVDGYTDVLWRDAPLAEVLPEAGVLCGIGLLLFLAAWWALERRTRAR